MMNKNAKDLLKYETHNSGSTLSLEREKSYRERE
jgi:hypothetical protein